MNNLTNESKIQQQSNKLILARRANQKAVVQALPQPGGADILKAKLELRKKQ